MERATVNKIVLATLLLMISAIFMAMIRQFLTALLLAGIFSAMAQPVYRKINGLVGNRPRAASGLTLLLFCLVVLLPLSGLVTIITAQAIKVTQSITPWVQHQIAQPEDITKYLRGLPFYDLVAPYRADIIRKSGELASWLSLFLINSLSAGAIGTVNFFFTIFIFLYTSFFFLSDGSALLDRILYYLPLEDRNERRLLDRFTSVTRATLKGTAVIGVLQGSLAGAAFAAAGIDAALFWGTVMSVLSLIPGIGTALIWLPASIALMVSGNFLKGVALAAFCGLVVGSLDNLLRPRLVGKDIKMHDLMIFLGTLGGLAFFGLIGFIIGPIIAALFVTVWDIYGEVFRDILPAIKRREPPAAAAGGAIGPPAEGPAGTDRQDPGARGEP